MNVKDIEIESRSDETSLVPKFGSIFGAFFVAIALIPLVVFVFAQFGARYFYLAELINNFRMYLLFMLLPFPFLLWATSRNTLAAIMAVATIWCAWGVVTVYLPSVQPPAGSQPVKIMSFNLLAGNRAHRAVLNRIEEIDADVLVLVEYQVPWDDVMSVIKDKYPYQIEQPRWHGYGIAIFSKLPLQNENVFSLAEEYTDAPVVAATIDQNGQPLRIVGVHTVSPTNVFRSNLRNNQLVELANVLRTDHVPTVVLGDFNCPPWSTFMKQFARDTEYRDSRQGFGYQGSWHAHYRIMSIPIDHAYVSPDVHVHDRKIAGPAGSDHLPLVVTVSLTGT